MRQHCKPRESGKQPRQQRTSSTRHLVIPLRYSGFKLRNLFSECRRKAPCPLPAFPRRTFPSKSLFVSQLIVGWNASSSWPRTSHSARCRLRRRRPMGCSGNDVGCMVCGGSSPCVQWPWFPVVAALFSTETRNRIVIPGSQGRPR